MKNKRHVEHNLPNAFEDRMNSFRPDDVETIFTINDETGTVANTLNYYLQDKPELEADMIISNNVGLGLLNGNFALEDLLVEATFTISDPDDNLYSSIVLDLTKELVIEILTYKKDIAKERISALLDEFNRTTKGYRLQYSFKNA